MSDEGRRVSAPAFVLNWKSATLIGIALGILFLIIGLAAEVRALLYIGWGVVPLACFAGGLYLKDEGSPVRVALIAAAALVLAAAIGIPILVAFTRF